MFFRGKTLLFFFCLHNENHPPGGRFQMGFCVERSGCIGKLSRVRKGGTKCVRWWAQNDRSPDFVRGFFYTSRQSFVLYLKLMYFWAKSTKKANIAIDILKNMYYNYFIKMRCEFCFCKIQTKCREKIIYRGEYCEKKAFITVDMLAFGDNTCNLCVVPSDDGYCRRRNIA